MTSHYQPPAKGYCKPCKVTYEWEGRPARADARCKRCGGVLTMAPRRGIGKLLLEKPAEAAQARAS